MNVRSLIAASLLAASFMPSQASATDNDLRSVAGMQNHARVLLVFAPNLKDARLIAQQREMARFAVGAAERDLMFVQVADGRVLGAKDDARRLQRKYRVHADAYRTLLIGKDGNVVANEAGPIAATRVQAAIDAMPMRQAEVVRARAGLGKPGGQP